MKKLLDKKGYKYVYGKSSNNQGIIMERIKFERRCKMKFRERPYLESITIAGHKKKHKEKTSKIKVP